LRVDSTLPGLSGETIWIRGCHTLFDHIRCPILNVFVLETGGATRGMTILGLDDVGELR